MDLSGSGFIDLHQFNGASNDGALPYGSVTLLGGVLYGMTEYGGASNNGMVFSINTNGSSFTDIHDFTGSLTDGSYPVGSLTANGSILMGITGNGGTYGDGIIFSINTTGSSFSDLYNFDGYPDGSYPLGQLTVSGTVMYGVTHGGGADGEGILFSVNTDGSSFNDLHDFTFASNDGYSPYYMQLLLTSNNLYGMTFAGGLNNSGIIFDYNLAYCNLTATANATTNVSCTGGSNGSATANPVSGKSPFTYLWSDGGSQTTATASNLSAGNYTVTVKDSNGCNATASVTITQPMAFSMGAGVISHATCNGSANGRATATPNNGTAPYTYSWVNSAHTVISTVQSTPAILSAGSYTVTVKDNCGASKTATVTITQPTGVHSSISSVTNVGCNGGNSGKATATASGGTYPYSYTWSSGSTLVTASGLTAGSYTVTVTDSHGCSATNVAPVATLTQPSVLSASLAGPVTEAECHGGKGSATISAGGGTSPYTYLWSPNVGSTATSTKLTAGSYSVTVEDAHGCKSSVVVISVTQPVAIH
jgi:uncharacterized repeat protein (TIGR03803 family)